MAATRTILLAVATMAILSTASAAIYNVGEPGGAWDLSTNYDTWASSRNFHPSDRIVFKYSPQAHDVLEVSKADYDSCSTASPIATLNSGNDVVSLTATGTRYFICGFPGHCAGGMKVKIDVVPSSSSSSPAPASGPSASNAPPPVPVSAATSVATTGFGLAILLIVAGLMS
ncbi:mavicyanin-like [Hordeum vulgare subsp. vulgare]|uniref:Phytocyanin domain-containing protein n=1 Tax=Hordeum vulgare subsp. vulgare TaxID=112509 RepID=A0A8I6WXG6_HORVV|nr:mavicyanin-like [Hordeum vulgare subsp. vulgare]